MQGLQAADVVGGAAGSVQPPAPLAAEASVAPRVGADLYAFRQAPTACQIAPREDVGQRDRNVRLMSLDDDQLDAWNERVAICMVDGGLSQAEAEAVAWREVEGMAGGAEKSSGQTGGHLAAACFVREHPARYCDSGTLPTAAAMSTPLRPTLAYGPQGLGGSIQPPSGACVGDGGERGPRRG
jgi:hypothetical protein